MSGTVVGANISILDKVCLSCLLGKALSKPLSHNQDNCAPSTLAANAEGNAQLMNTLSVRIHLSLIKVHASSGLA
ncbi:hypothetical protein NQZ68_005542 [Dissostichus eleginoides]|nr:hypothetical protein NQZ68_005542 [Dissostichus eleginoides]